MFLPQEAQFSQDCIASLSTYSRHVLSFTTSCPQINPTTLPNGFVVGETFSVLTSLLSHLSSDQLESLCLNLLRMFSLQSAHTVIDQFLFGSLSAVETIASFSNQWLHDKVSQYTSEEMIPDSERESYNLTIETLLSLSTFPEQNTISKKDDLSYSIREKVFVLLSQCYIGSQYKWRLWCVIAIYASKFLYLRDMFPLYVACFQLLKLVSETWSAELINDFAIQRYIDIWSIIDYWSSSRLKWKSKNQELIIKYASFEAVLTGIIEVWARRIPKVVPLKCSQLKKCVELLEEAIRIQFSRYQFIMEYYHCLCSFRNVFVYLSVDVQQSILVSLNSYIKL